MTSTRLSRFVGLGSAIALSCAIATAWNTVPVQAQTGPVHPVCLIGEWHAVDVLTYMRSAIHVGEVESVSGPYFVSFHPDGRMTQNIDVTVNATSMMGDRFVERIMVVGSADYHDSIDAVLTISNPLIGGNVDIEINGEPFIQGADPGPMAFQDQQRMSYACNGDRMTLQPDFGDGRVALLNFQRYGPAAMVAPPTAD